VVRAHGRGGVGNALPFDRTWVIGGQALALDRRHAPHTKYPARGGRAATNNTTKRRAFADAVHDIKHSLGIPVGDSSASHGNAHGNAHVDGVNADIIAHVVVLGDGIKVANA